MNLQQMQQNIGNMLYPQQPSFYPGLGGNNPQMQNYQMRMFPGMSQTGVAAPQQIPYAQYLRDNKAQDTPINKLAWMKGLKPNQAGQLANMQ